MLRSESPKPPHCDQCKFEWSEQLSVRHFCPNCGAPQLQLEHDEEATIIAKFQSVAEAGFYSDALNAESIANRVIHQSSFDEVNARHYDTYLLIVRSEDAPLVSDSIKQTMDSEAQFLSDNQFLDDESYENSNGFLAKSLPLLLASLCGVLIGFTCCYPSMIKSPIESVAARAETLWSDSSNSIHAVQFMEDQTTMRVLIDGFPVAQQDLKNLPTAKRAGQDYHFKKTITFNTER